MNKKYIATGQELRKGDFLLSPNGDYKAVFQEDGNFVVYKWAPIWATHTHGKPSDHVVLQNDRNLVIYTKDAIPLWASNTSISGSNFQDLRLVVTNEGTLEMSNRGTPVWNSKHGLL